MYIVYKFKLYLYDLKQVNMFNRCNLSYRFTNFELNLVYFVNCLVKYFAL